MVGSEPEESAWRSYTYLGTRGTIARDVFENRDVRRFDDNNNNNNVERVWIYIFLNTFAACIIIVSKCLFFFLPGRFRQKTATIIIVVPKYERIAAMDVYVDPPAVVCVQQWPNGLENIIQNVVTIIVE